MTRRHGDKAAIPLGRQMKGGHRCDQRDQSRWGRCRCTPREGCKEGVHEEGNEEQQGIGGGIAGFRGRGFGRTEQVGEQADVDQGYPERQQDPGAARPPQGVREPTRELDGTDEADRGVQARDHDAGQRWGCRRGRRHRRRRRRTRSRFRSGREGTGRDQARRPGEAVGEVEVGRQDRESEEPFGEGVPGVS